MMSSSQGRAIAVGVVAACAAFFVFGGGRGSPSRAGADPMDAVPSASFIVASADMASLRKSPIYTTVVGADVTSASTLGLRPLAESCGFDPLTRVTTMAISVPEEGDQGEFGVAATVDLNASELERCSSALGSGVTRRNVGSFTLLERGAGAHLALGKGGLLLVGSGTWLEDMMEAYDRRGPSLRDSKEHAALRTRLSSAEGFRKPTLLVSALLPAALRDRLKGEMGKDVTAGDPSAAMMTGVLGVSAVGVAVNAGSDGQPLEAFAELVCDGADGCAQVERLLRKKQAEWSKEIALRLIGLGGALDSAVITRENSRVTVRLSADADAIAGALARVLRGRGGGDRRAPPAGAPRETP